MLVVPHLTTELPLFSSHTAALGVVPSNPGMCRTEMSPKAPAAAALLHHCVLIKGPHRSKKNSDSCFLGVSVAAQAQPSRSPQRKKPGEARLTISTRFPCSTGMIQYEWNSKHSLLSAALEGTGSQAHSPWWWCWDTEQARLSPISCATGKAWDSVGSWFLCVREHLVPCVKHIIKGGGWQCQLVCLCQ